MDDVADDGTGVIFRHLSQGQIADARRVVEAEHQHGAAAVFAMSGHDPGPLRGQVFRIRRFCGAIVETQLLGDQPSTGVGDGGVNVFHCCSPFIGVLWLVVAEASWLLLPAIWPTLRRR